MKMWSGVSIMPYFLYSVTSIKFTSGVAFTIDPAFAAEVRAELGTMTCLLLGSLNLHRADLFWTDYREKVSKVSYKALYVFRNSFIHARMVIPWRSSTFTG